MSQQTKPTDPNIIKMKNVRLSYPHLFVAKQGDEGGEPKYGATFILDKKIHAPLIAHIEKQAERVALDFFKKKIKLNRNCLRDGNDYADKEGYGDEVMFISAKETRRPVVVDRDMTPLTKDDSRPYAGCYVNANVRLFAYDHKGSKGVSAALRSIQFVRDGDSFGAGPIDPSEEFEAVSDDVDNY